ncbi:MAG: NAD-dependent epimerase/dehydratase family protein [Atribacterota bacterium]
MKVLITGGAGYIGSILTRILLARGYSVRILDILRFSGESLLGIINNPNLEFIKGDIRDIKTLEKSINDIDAVVHLAAIVGDPACAHEPKAAEEINFDASVRLFNMCNALKNVKYFIFASTCSNYGKMGNNNYVNEDSPLHPISLYAKLKVNFEKYLLGSKTRFDFYPFSLRFATVYGISPRMRFDLTVNEFTRDATIKNELEIYGDQFWRPYCHVEDLARSCVLILESDIQKIKHRVLGVGDTRENYQKRMLVEEILKVIPNVKVRYIKKDEDPRDYKVDFSRIKNELGFRITKTVPQGIREIHFLIKNHIMADPENNLYRNS